MPALVPNQVGRHLEQARKAVGLTQLALAKAAGINRVQIVRMEAGRIVPRLDEVVRLAEVLKVPIEWFIAGRCMPTYDLRGIALELYRLGIRDLQVSDPRVPGSARHREEVLVIAVSGDRPEPRIVEAVPFLLLQRYYIVELVTAFAGVFDKRALTRLAWLSEIAQTLNRSGAMPHLTWSSASAGPAHLYALKKAGEQGLKKPTLLPEPDSLGHPGSGHFSPIWRRWNITYAGTMDDFRRRTIEVHAAFEANHTLLGDDM